MAGMMYAGFHSTYAEVVLAARLGGRFVISFNHADNYTGSFIDIPVMN